MVTTSTVKPGHRNKYSNNTGRTFIVSDIGIFRMIGPLLKKLGCCGVVVWLLISGVIATFYVGEYLERPAEQQSFWKAGVMVRKYVIITGLL